MTKMTNKSAKFIVSDLNNGSREVFADTESAARHILGHDGYEFDIRPIGGGFQLWVSSASRAAYGGFKMIESVIFAIDENEEAARAELFSRVCAHEAFGGANSTYCEKLTDHIENLRNQIADIDDEDELNSLRAELAELEALA